VAANCWVAPVAIDGLAGVTAIDTNAAVVTVRVVLPVTPAELALIVDVPLAIEVARPPAAMVATFVFDEVQVTEPVRF
jgi:hypothetical protein